MNLKVRKPPNDLAGSGWYEILPEPPPPEILDSTINADWVVIGGGFTGLTTARRLLENCPDDRIVVLDAQRIGWGAAGRNSGFMIDLPHDLQSKDYSGGTTRDRNQIKMNRFAIGYAKSMVNEYGLHSFMDTGGKINAATDVQGMNALRAYSEHLRELDESFEEYDAQVLKEITGIDYYAGGIHTPGCVQVQPAGYIRGIAQGLLQSSKNIKIYENSPITEIVSGETKRIKTPKGEVLSNRVVLAVNGHLESFGLFSKRLMHVFTYGSITRQLSVDELNRLGGRDQWGITPAHPMGTTVRKVKEGRIVVRNVFTYNGNMETTKDQVSQTGKRHDKAFRNRFPMLKDVSMEYRWGGHLCLSLNSAPAFGEVEKGVFASGCQNGLGAVQGTLGGILIADLASGRDNPMIKSLIEPGEPAKLYPEPFMTIGAKMNLWWNHLRAGKDL